jgi:hypothetical protein
MSEKNALTITILGSDLRSGRGVGDFARRVELELKSREQRCRIEDQMGAKSEFRPPAESEIVFLQFVPYAWHRRGLIGPKVRTEIVARCAGRPTAIFMHELWIGESKSDHWRNRLTGWWQRRGVLRLLKQLAPKLVITSIPAYRSILASHGVDAQLLALPSNLPGVTQEDRREARAWMESRGLGDDQLVTIGGVFGAIHPEWNPADAIIEWGRASAANGRDAILLVLGNSGPAAQQVLVRLAEKNPSVRVEYTGVLPPKKMSALIEQTTVGFATTPWALIGKSGSVAAFRSSGVPVVVTRNDWSWRRGPTPETKESPGLRLWNPGFDWDQIESERIPAGSSIEQTVEGLLDFLKRAKAL